MERGKGGARRREGYGAWLQLPFAAGHSSPDPSAASTATRRTHAPPSEAASCAATHLAAGWRRTQTPQAPPPAHRVSMQGPLWLMDRGASGVGAGAVSQRWRDRVPAVSYRGPAVSDRGPAVSDRGPAVSDRDSAVSPAGEAPVVSGVHLKSLVPCHKPRMIGGRHRLTRPCVRGA